MPKCAICEQDKQEGQEKKIYTARILKTERWKSGSTTTTRTTYGEFQMHNFFTCAKCHTIWDKIVLPVGGGLWGILCIVLFILGLKQNSDLMAFLCVFVFFGGLFTLIFTSIDERLKKRARQERESTDKIRAFTEKEYEKFLRDSQPPQ